MYLQCLSFHLFLAARILLLFTWYAGTQAVNQRSLPHSFHRFKSFALQRIAPVHQPTVACIEVRLVKPRCFSAAILAFFHWSGTTTTLLSLPGRLQGHSALTLILIPASLLDLPSSVVTRSAASCRLTADTARSARRAGARRATRVSACIRGHDALAGLRALRSLCSHGSCDCAPPWHAPARRCSVQVREWPRQGGSAYPVLRATRNHWPPPNILHTSVGLPLSPLSDVRGC